MKEMFASDSKEEMMHLSDLLASEGWRIYKKIVKWHQNNLSVIAIKQLQSGEVKEAQIAAIGVGECDKIVDLVKKRIKSLEGEK